MRQLNVGIVGLGWVAGAHIETLKSIEGIQATAVCSRRALNESELEGQFGIPLKAYQDYEKMLSDDSIDIIDICTPHPFHPEQAVAAARAGKHLIIEKPIGIAYEEVKDLREVIRQSAVHCCVCFEARFSTHFNLVRSCIEEGLLGDLHYAEVDYYHGIGPWYGQFEWNVKRDMGASSLLTAGCHALDGLLYFMDGAEVEEVSSYGARSRSEVFQPYEYDTTSVTILKFKDGRLGKVASVIDCLQPYYFHLHLVGSEGSLLDNKIYSEKLRGLVKEKWSTLETELIDSGDVSEHPYTPQFEAFKEAILNDRKMPLSDFETAYQSHRVVFAADLSAVEGRPVRLSEFD